MEYLVFILFLIDFGWLIALTITVLDGDESTRALIKNLHCRLVNHEQWTKKELHKLSADKADVNELKNKCFRR